MYDENEFERAERYVKEDAGYFAQEQVKHFEKHSTILSKAVVKLWYEAHIDDEEKKKIKEALGYCGGYILSEDSLYEIFDEEENE